MRRGPRAIELCVGVFDQRQAANACTDDAGNACGQLIVQCLACGQAGVRALPAAAAAMPK
jgi:hypothetical protein